MQKKNCWEFKRCGREQGGYNAGELGVCPATNEPRLDGVHDGKCGGRSCWMLEGTSCHISAQGKPIKKLQHCMACDFYGMVRDEERSAFKMAALLMRKLQPEAHGAQLSR